MVFVIVLYIRHVLTNGNDVRRKNNRNDSDQQLIINVYLNGAMISFRTFLIANSHSIDWSEFICLLGSSLSWICGGFIHDQQSSAGFFLPLIN